MSNRHELRAYDYVSQPYEAVRAALLADPLAVFRRATNTAALRNEAIGAELHATAGPFDVAAEIAIDIVAIEAGRSPNDHPATDIVIEWKAVRRPGLFPTMRARFSVYALTPTETQLELEGIYDPPLGVFGDAIDAVAMSSIAKESVAGFVRDVAVFLRESKRGQAA